ncbi:hypothetical protein CMUS01_11590 [Colletotrichum musicola]|uniref:Nuclear pore protein n=1 Tax=Colletotrichum musicola TaxID=2175873 RepID=A0A8H6JX34_9PEZI|nr:hypothetical protein CMUS01_11590 [Colletotrichum musicola]
MSLAPACGASVPAAEVPPVAVKKETPSSDVEPDVKEEPDSDEDLNVKDESEPDEEIGDVSVLVWDPSGDLYLHVGPEADRRIFQAMLEESPNPGLSAEPGTSSEDWEDWEIDLDEDPPEDMKRFLAIVHAKFQYVPRTLSIPELYRFLKLLQKYDAMAVIRPWAQAWLDGVKQQTTEPWLLWVAWTMGDAMLFREMLFKIADNAKILHGSVSYGEPGRHWTPEGWRGPTEEWRVPVDALDGLSAANVIKLVQDHRKNLVSLELDMYRRMVKVMRRNEQPDARRSGCTAALIGETIMRLHKYGLDLMAPGPDVASRYERSHQNLGRVLPEKRAAICSITHCKKCPFPMSSFTKKAEERK